MSRPGPPGFSLGVVGRTALTLPEESHVLQTLRRRLQGEREGGFTLIELMGS